MQTDTAYHVFRFQSDLILSYSDKGEKYIQLLKRFDDCGAVAGKTDWFFPKNTFPPYKVSIAENFGQKIIINITSPNTSGQNGFPKELESILDAFDFKMISEKE